MILSGQVHCRHEIIRQLLARMLIHPFLRDRHKLLVEAQPALTVIFEREVRLDSRRRSHHRSRAARRRLGDDRDVADAFLANRCPNFRVYLSHYLHKTALQIFVGLERRERALLCRNIR
ncbi:hypothetical protein D3C77_466370 [compost metagenome]